MVGRVRVVTAQGGNKFTKHRNIFMLEHTYILTCFIHEDIDDATGADADPEHV